MNGFETYKSLASVPDNALKKIEFGKLKGKSDINPQWRYEALTQAFGLCGVGWKYEVVKTWTQEAPNSQLMLFVEVHLYVKTDGEWSAPIPAIGGDFLIEADKNGLHGNDEAYKMATTDGLGTAAKMVGVAADVYRGLPPQTKHGRQEERKTTPSPTQPKQSESRKEESVTASDPQLKKLFATAREQALSSEDMKGLLHWKYGVSSSKELTKSQASDAIAHLATIWEEYVATQSKAS